MTEPTKRTKAASGRMSRSETVSVRLDPKLRYLAELAARKQRRTLSSYIEWAVEESLRRVNLYEGTGHGGDESVCVADNAARLWDVDESERFVKLAIAYPELMTHEEQERWKMISDSGLLEPARSRDSLGNLSWNHGKLEDLVYPAIRSQWESMLHAHAIGPSARQAWVNTVRIRIREGSVFPAPAGKKTDDDIPF